MFVRISGGWSLVWDCTCVDTFAGVRLNWSAMEAGTSGTLLLQRDNSVSQLQSIPMAVYGGCNGVILRAIGHRLIKAKEELREANWLVKT